MTLNITRYIAVSITAVFLLASCAKQEKTEEGSEQQFIGESGDHGCAR